MKISERWTMKKNLQYFHLQASHPPKIGVEYYNVNTFPILAMLIDWTFSNNPIRYSMNDGIVWVWFKKKRCPVELNCGIVFLIQHIRSITRNRKHKYKAKIRNISKCLFEFKCFTFAVNTVSESKVSIDFSSSGMSLWRRHTKETYWPRLRESPTNIILFPRSVSSTKLALNLQ